MKLKRLKKAFPLGQVVITPNTLEQLHPQDLHDALWCHALGNWGDLARDDRIENDLALEEGGRLWSKYRDRNRRKFWILTEADRSSTCVLLPEDSEEDGLPEHALDYLRWGETHAEDPQPLAAPKAVEIYG